MTENKVDINSDGLLPQNIWQLSLFEYLQQKIDDTGDNHKLINSLLCSLDNCTHMVGIDTADIINLFAINHKLAITFYEFQEKYGVINRDAILNHIPSRSPIYLHFQSDSIEKEGQTLGTVLALVDLQYILEPYFEIDPECDTLFSFTFTLSKGSKVKMWAIFPAEF